MILRSFPFPVFLSLQLLLCDMLTGDVRQALAAEVDVKLNQPDDGVTQPSNLVTAAWAFQQLLPGWQPHERIVAALEAFAKKPVPLRRSAQ